MDSQGRHPLSHPSRITVLRSEPTEEAPPVGATAKVANILFLKLPDVRQCPGGVGVGGRVRMRKDGVRGGGEKAEGRLPEADRWGG